MIANFISVDINTVKLRYNSTHQASANNLVFLSFQCKIKMGIKLSFCQ